MFNNTATKNVLEPFISSVITIFNVSDLMHIRKFIGNRTLLIADVTLQTKILTSSPNFILIFYLGLVGDTHSAAEIAMLLATSSMLVPVLTLGRHIGIKRFYHSVGNDAQKAFLSSIFAFSYATIILVSILVVTIRHSFDLSVIAQESKYIDIIIISSICGALNQAPLNALIITLHTRLIKMNVYFAFLIRLLTFFYLYQISNLDVLTSFLLSQAIFNAIFWTLNLFYTRKNKLIEPIFEKKYITFTSKFSNSLTPELILSQSLIFIERLFINVFLSPDVLGFYIILLNLFAPINLIATSFKQSFNDNIFFQKTIDKQRNAFQKDILKFVSLFTVTILIYIALF